MVPTAFDRQTTNVSEVRFEMNHNNKYLVAAAKNMKLPPTTRREEELSLMDSRTNPETQFSDNRRHTPTDYA